MKKVFVMLAAAACSIAAMATEYTGKLTVTINGISSEQETTISINEETGKYNLDLNNFILVSEETTMGVGNINLHGIQATNAYGFDNIKFNVNVQIAEGDLEGIEFWMGPFLGDVPCVMNADFNASALSVHIDIDMMETALEQMILVDFVGIAPVAPAKPDPDVNGDGAVDVEDVSTVINSILGL